MEIERHTSQDLLSGNVSDLELQRQVEQSIVTTTLGRAVDWARGNAMFPATLLSTANAPPTAVPSRTKTIAGR